MIIKNSYNNCCKRDTGSMNSIDLCSLTIDFFEWILAILSFIFFCLIIGKPFRKLLWTEKDVWRIDLHRSENDYEKSIEKLRIYINRICLYLRFCTVKRSMATVYRAQSYFTQSSSSDRLYIHLPCSAVKE